MSDDRKFWSKYDYLLFFWLLLFFVTLARLLFIGSLGLGDSEAYYWVWSKHPALSYYDHPPVVAYMIRLFTAIGRDSSFFVRLGPVLLFPFTVLMTALIYREIGPEKDYPRSLFYIALLLVLTPAMAVGGVSASPDTPLAFFLSGFLLFLFKAVMKFKGPYLLVAGVFLGLAAASKYFAVLYYPILLAFFLRKDMRKWWKGPWLYLAGLAALIGMLPALLWNAGNHWASFAFHLKERHHGAGLSLENFGRLAGGQLLYMSPLILAGLFWALKKAFDRHKRGDVRASLVVYTTLPYIGFFYLVTLITPEAEPHWPLMGFLPLYPMLLAAWQESGPGRRKRRLAAWTLGSSLAMVLLIHVYVLTPWISKAMPKRIYEANAKFDIANELRGWPELGKAVKQELKKRGGTFAFSYHYTVCSQLTFALYPDYKVYCPNTRNDEFDFLGLSSPPIGGSGIFVGDWRYHVNPAKIYSCGYMDKKPRFVVVYAHGLKAREFMLFWCKDYNGLKPDAPAGL
ncbi:MAG: glycosyltransferase family 39 protein [Deltaproteobacteria bacterium]|nr:glycosyltransferase family 39 protein [Deltaproteobacteria bacterium]